MHDVAELVARAAVESPDRTAIVEAEGRRLTWSELDEEVSRVAAGLGDAGIVAGRRVLLVLGNSAEFVTTYLAVLRAQAVAVPVDPHTPADELVRIIIDSGSRLAVAEASTLEGVRAAIARARRQVRTGVATIVVGQPRDDERSYADLAATAPRTIPPLPDPEKLAVLLYVGARSGRRRAVMLTHRALIANVDQVAGIEPRVIRDDDVLFAAVPLFCSFGLNAVLGGALRAGATIVLPRRFDRQGTLDLIAEHGGTVLALAPAIFDPSSPRREPPPHGLPGRLESVRLVLSGSAVLDGGEIVGFERRTGTTLHQGYGLAEAAPVVTTTVLAQDHRTGSVGVPLPGVEMGLTDQHGTQVQPGDPGEIRIRGANLFSGYWPDGAGGPDDDGWWATGDLGVLDADGSLFLVDRLADVISVAGFNVYPREVEDVIRSTFGVQQAAVVGVPVDSAGELTGRDPVVEVVAYVVASGSDPAATRDAVRRQCRDRLAGFKQPTRVEVVDTLPPSAVPRQRAR